MLALLTEVTHAILMLLPGASYLCLCSKVERRDAPGRSAGTRRAQTRMRREAPGRAACRRERAGTRQDTPRAGRTPVSIFPTLPNPPTITTLPSTLSQASAHSLCDRNVHDPTTLRDVSVLPQIIFY